MYQKNSCKHCTTDNKYKRRRRRREEREREREREREGETKRETEREREGCPNISRLIYWEKRDIESNRPLL